MALIPTNSWDETKPAGTRDANLGDDDIREMKTQIREVINVDHDFPSSGQAADNGQHKQVTLQEQADLGTGAEGATILGSQTVDGKGELVYTDEDDNDVQMTKSGKNYAGLVADGAETDSDAAPTEDAGISNKKYVDDAIAAAIAALVTVPSGIIATWSGSEATIPDGWVLCDGDNSTPDLRDKFIIGAAASASHANTVGASKDNTLMAGTGSTITLQTGSSSVEDGNEASQSFTPANRDVIPPYYALCFIMKS